MNPVRRVLTLCAALLSLSACDKLRAITHIGAAKGPIDADKLGALIDPSFGGPDTCVVINDTRTGAELYRYGSHAVCMRALPPCSTFEVVNDLIGLDKGLITPATVFAWDRTPQPIQAWQHDADVKAAFKDSIVWWHQRLAGMIGLPTFEERLRAFDYGGKKPDGPVGSFWMGPSAGGGLTITTDQQAAFMHRLYADRLDVKPENAAFIKTLLVDETRGDVTMSGKTGSCATVPDRSRLVGWWTGRLQSPRADYVFAVSVESDSEQALPGAEVETRVKDVFSRAGLWPAASRN